MAPAEPKLEELWAVDFGSEDRELTLPALIESIQRGEVKNDTLVWRVGMPGWQSAAEVAALAVHFTGTSPKPDAAAALFDAGDDDEKEVVAVASSSADDADVVTSAPTPAIKPATTAAAAPAAPPTPIAGPAAPRAPAAPPALPAQAAPAPRAASPFPEPAAIAPAPAPAVPLGAPGGPIPSDVSALLRAQAARKKKVIILAAVLGAAVVTILLVLMATSGGTSEAPASSATTETPLPIATKPTSRPTTTEQPTPAPQGKSFSEMFAAAASANSGSAFDADEARKVVEGAVAQLASCRGFGSQPGSVSVEVSFAPRGMAIAAKVGPPYGGTAPGTCMESALKSLRVKPFSGASGSVKTTLRLP
jgi:hypothetical protein